MRKLTNLVREHTLVVEQALCPVHQRIDVLRRGQLRRALVLCTVFPEVLVPAWHQRYVPHILCMYAPGAGGHDRALCWHQISAAVVEDGETYLLCGAELGDGAVEHVKVVEKVDRWKGCVNAGAPVRVN